MKTKRVKPSDEPLLVRVTGGRLIISVGIDTFAFAQHVIIQNEDYGKKETFLIRKPGVFAVEVMHEMEKEREDGSTILTDLLDLASRRAIENGSVAGEVVK